MFVIEQMLRFDEETPSFGGVTDGDIFNAGGSTPFLFLHLRVTWVNNYYM